MLMRLARIVIVLSLCLWSAAAFPTNLVPRGSLLRNSRKIQRFNKCCCGQYPSSAHASMDASRKYSNGGFKNQFRTTIQRVLKNNVHASSIPESKLQKAPQQQSPLIIKQANGFALSGSLLPGIRRLVAGGSQAYKSGVEAVQIYHHPGDVAVLALLSLAVNPIVRILHSAYYRIAGLLLGNKKPVKPYEDSKFSDAAQFVTQGGRIASIVYVVEVAVTFLVAVLASHPSAPRTRPPPNNLIPLTKVPDLFANCAYGYWLARKVVRAKSRLLQRYRLTDTYDAALDFIIYLIASILVLESSSVNLTALVRSLVAVGGLSSLVVGLALQGPATQILQGGLLLAANKFRKNEVIKLGDGTSGKVIDIGLMEVTILGEFCTVHIVMVELNAGGKQTVSWWMLSTNGIFRLTL
jgi:hypothetical protein